MKHHLHQKESESLTSLYECDVCSSNIFIVWGDRMGGQEVDEVTIIR